MKLSQLIAALCVYLFFHLSGGQNVHAQESSESIREIEITGSSVNFRSKPSSKSRVIEALKLGQRGVILENQGNWFKVQVGENIGWLHQSTFKDLPSRSFTRDGALSISSSGEEPLPKEGVVHAFNLGLKDSPNGEVVANLKYGTKLEILGQNENSYEVKAGTQTGWVAKPSVSCDPARIHHIQDMREVIDFVGEQYAEYVGDSDDADTEEAMNEAERLNEDDQAREGRSPSASGNEDWIETLVKNAEKEGNQRCRVGSKGKICKKGSKSLCLQAVREAVQTTAGESTATSWTKHARDAGPYLEKYGMVNKIDEYPNAADVPKGAVLVFKGGKSGHIEVFTGDQYCSDFCSPTPIDVRLNRQLIGVYVPTE